MPGQPQFTVRHKPGAASLNLVSELYNVLPRDGTVFGMFARSVAMDRLLGRAGANFNPVEFNWIGSANNEVSICAVWHAVGIRTIDAFMARPLTFAANAPGAESDVFPRILNNLARHQIQGRHRLSRRQRPEPGDGARRNRRTLRLDLVGGQGRARRLDRETTRSTSPCSSRPRSIRSCHMCRW